jgi:nickel-dependent lactate racemase
VVVAVAVVVAVSEVIVEVLVVVDDGVLPTSPVGFGGGIKSTTPSIAEKKSTSRMIIFSSVGTFLLYKINITDIRL